MADYLLQQGGSYILLEDGSKIILEDGIIDDDILTKLILHSAYPAFINKAERTGTLTMSGTTTGGVNTQSFTIELGYEPDTIDLMFTGPAVSGKPRPAGAWFRQGSISVPYTGTGDAEWFLFSKISGTSLIITGIFLQPSVGTETLTSTKFDYKIVDYTVF